MEEPSFKQRCAINVCVKLGETGIVTFNKLKQAYREHALSRSQVFKRYKALSVVRESIKDEPRSGRPSTSKTDNNVEKVRALVRSDRRLTARMIAYLLTPRGRVLLEKLTGSAASQEIPRIFGTRRFITVLTSAHHLSLSSANSIQSPQPPPTS